MNFLELVKTRHSVRAYKDRPIEKEKIEYILECARLAPSAVNFQPWQLLLVKSATGKKDLQQCYSREWLSTAPLCILVCTDLSQSWKRLADGKDHGDIDAAILAEHICLAATEQGLGSCWVCNFDVNKCKKLFGLPDSLQPVVILPLGYSDSGNIPGTSRKNLREIIREV